MRPICQWRDGQINAASSSVPHAFVGRLAALPACLPVVAARPSGVESPPSACVFTRGKSVFSSHSHRSPKVELAKLVGPLRLVWFAI